MKTPWFGAKAYGIGISPTGLAGWLCLLVYVAGMGGAVTLGQQLGLAAWMVGLTMLALTIGLCAVIVIKGDQQPWRWRWGGR